MAGAGAAHGLRACRHALNNWKIGLTSALFYCRQPISDTSTHNNPTNMSVATANSISANSFLSLPTGRLCASFAPSGAVSTLAIEMPSKAGKYTKPSDSGGSPPACKPLTMNPTAPASAIGNPTADEVPITVRIGTLHQVRNGIDTAPPPTPTKLESTPATPPTSDMPALPGSSRPGFGLILTSI